MPTIRILSDQLVSQIAAGEVVERPASVVKELLENALDAGSTSLGIELEGGGARRVSVADDGAGMDRDDALLAFDRHATSKIAEFADLERVGTLGFRGEALASIGAVSKIELTTARAPGDGTRVRIEGGKVLSVEPLARDRGTTIDVRSLFWNVPARRKFLKRRETELRRAVEVVEGYALARPDVGFRVGSEGRLLLEAPRLGADGESLRVRIAQLFGPGLESQLEEISGGEREGVRGLVGTPRTSRGRRSFLFVNRRLVRDRALLATFYRAVREEWRSDEFPSLFLFLDLPPERVDVNVHPQKAEVRFRDPGYPDRVGEILRAALGRARREEAAPLRAPGAGALGAPAAWEGLGGRPAEGSASPPRDRGFQGRERGTGDRGGGVDALGSATAEPSSPFYGASSGERDGSAPAMGESAGRIAVPVFAPLDRPTVPLSGRSGAVRPFRLLGQYKGTLVLLEGPDGLYLLDQHVAHERILYERLRRQLEAEKGASQRLMTPLLLELSKAEAMHLSVLAPALGRVGFELEELSGGSIGVSAAPAGLGAEEARGLLLELATDHEASAENLGRRLLDDFAASMACKAAVKMHHPLSAEKLEALVSELFRAENPYACPHGRPVVLVLHDADLERRFGRR
ncbi:MAG TPA: DNA mismatch repair endonuclease MutL [Thermoanaerobaculia bacterium]|nr:DNA mismatch repair endonuclease MutL [Thermoanaerobaculia bacterium]